MKSIRPSRSQKDFKCSPWRNLHILRPNLIDYINLSKVLDSYMRRCKCTGGIQGVGFFFSLKNISSSDIGWGFLVPNNPQKFRWSINKGVNYSVSLVNWQNFLHNYHLITALSTVYRAYLIISGTEILCETVLVEPWDSRYVFSFMSVGFCLASTSWSRTLILLFSCWQ